MAELNTFPGVGALAHDNEKAVIEPGLYNDSPRTSESVESDEVDEELDRTVRWKRDLLLMPVLGVLYTMMFLDRTNIANARIEGLEASLNMPSHGYNNCLWIFYIPFVLAEVPSNLFLTMGYIKPRIFLGGQMFLIGMYETCLQMGKQELTLLGVLGMCQGLTGSYGGLLAVRFLLGALEASLPAGAAYMLSRYYTKHESTPRFACFFNFAMLGPMFSGLLAFAIENLNGRGGLEGWRWIFIIEGIMTCVFAGLVFALLPDFPENAKSWFLKERERLYLLQKLERSRGKEQQGSASDNVPLWRILTDWRIHLFTMCFFCCDMTGASLSGFAPTILAQLGYTASRAQLLTMPIWGAALVVSQATNTIASRLNLRFPFVLGGICLDLVGWIIMRVYVPQAGIRYFAMFLMSMGTFLQMPMLMGWLSINLRGRRVRISLPSL